MDGLQNKSPRLQWVMQYTDSAWSHSILNMMEILHSHQSRFRDALIREKQTLVLLVIGLGKGEPQSFMDSQFMYPRKDGYVEVTMVVWEPMQRGFKWTIGHASDHSSTRESKRASWRFSSNSIIG